MKRRLISVMMIFTLLATSVFSSFAADTNISEDSFNICTPGTKITFDDATSSVIAPRASDEPTAYRNLSYESYTAELIDLAATKSSYTLYYFSTGTGQIVCEFDLERSGTSTQDMRELMLYLYERSSDNDSWSLADTSGIQWYTVQTSGRLRFRNLNPNNQYYIRFYNDSASSTSSRCDISGTIVVSE